jgi:hypothetical protein
MPPRCIFCDNESGSEEHLWPDWMHKIVKFAPINIQEANGPIITGQDPEQTINTVCHTCNNGWMSRIEQKNVPRLKPMLLNGPITIDPGGMKILTEWAVNRAMVSAVRFHRELASSRRPSLHADDAETPCRRA